MFAYVATKLVPGETAHEAGEQIRVVPMSPAEALKATGAGRIKDAKTMVALLYYERFVRDGGR
jgi:hypothetical protein